MISDWLLEKIIISDWLLEELVISDWRFMFLINKQKSVTVKPF